MFWGFSDGDTGIAIDGGRVVIEVRSVTCNDCLRDPSLLASKLPLRDPGATRRMMLKRRVKRPSMEECFCLFSVGTPDTLERVWAMEDVEEDLKML